MSKLRPLRDAIAEFVPDGSSVAMNVQMEQMIPFAAGHELMRQRRRDLTLICPISDILFDQLIGAGCVRRVIGAWIGNVMMGSAYNFRREVESGRVEVTNMTNFTIALALQAAALGVPFLPTLSALGSDVARDNEYFTVIENPFDGSAGVPPAGAEASRLRTLLAVKALHPDVAIIHLQRADRHGNAHCWGNFGIMLGAARAAKRVILTAEEIVDEEVIASDPNRTVIPGFMVSAVCEVPFGAHPSPIQGYYKRDDAFFQEYHQQTKASDDFSRWADRWVYGVADRNEYTKLLGVARAESLKTKQHAFAAPTDFGY